MIPIVQGYELNTREAIDNRLLLSKAEMKSVNDKHMPEKYFAVCKDDCMLYLYDKNTDVISVETGKFKLYNSCKIESISVNGEVLPIEELNVDLPLATAERYGLGLPGLGLKAENGIFSIDFNGIPDGAIPFEKVDWEDVIISGDNISTSI